MGAVGWQRRVEARLRAIGRRIPTRGAEPAAPGAELSAREQEVLDLLALGLRNRDIGERLFISERTVARHLVQIYAKLGVSTRTAAVRVGRERGLLAGVDPR
jgi:DNA-binding NarL/FixJ family response regulator